MGSLNTGGAIGNALQTQALTLSARHTVGQILTANTAIAFNTIISGDLTMPNQTTVRLPAGGKYLVMASVGAGGSGVRPLSRLWNATAGVYVGSSAISMSPMDTALNVPAIGMLSEIITSTVDTDIQVRSLTTSVVPFGQGANGDQVDGYAWIKVIQLTSNITPTALARRYLHSALTSNVSVNSAAAVPFTQINGNLQLSAGVVTLPANSVFLLEGNLGYVPASVGLAGSLSYQWRNITANQLIGSIGVSLSGNSTLAESGVSSAVASVVVGPTPITVRLENRSAAAVTVSGSALGGNSSIKITEMGGTALLTPPVSSSMIGSDGQGNLVSRRIKSFVLRGTDTTYDNLKFRISGGGNRSLQVFTVSGTLTLKGSCRYTVGTIVAGQTVSNINVTTTPIYLVATHNFLNAGDSCEWLLYDEINFRAYKVTSIFGDLLNINCMTIEEF